MRFATKCVFSSMLLLPRNVFPQVGVPGAESALSDFCTSLTELLPVVAMLMVIGAGVIYSSGQIMGAETRARATTWSTAMLIGAIIGILIVVVAPPALAAIYGCTVRCGGGAVWGSDSC